MNPELKRLRDVYRKRDSEVSDARYSVADSAYSFEQHCIDRELAVHFRRLRISPASWKRVVDIGCGFGRWGRRLEGFGVGKDRLVGVDALWWRLRDGMDATAQYQLLVQGDARHLPLLNGALDAAVVSTVVSSILTDKDRVLLASEVSRVLRPAGVVIWYDFRLPNPANSNVKAVPRTVVESLFPGFDIALSNVTLIPPLARRVVPLGLRLASMMHGVSFLTSHLVGVLRKRN